MNKVFNIGGEDRPVNFGRNAIMEFERLTGLSFMWRVENNTLLPPNVGNAFSTIDRCVRMVYCGLKWGLYDTARKQEPVPTFTLPEVAIWTGDDEDATAQILAYCLESMKVKNPLSSGEGRGEAEKKSSPGPTSISSAPG